MSFINFSTREINIKIVYHGPDLSGKTTSLEHIYSKSDPRERGRSISSPTETSRGLFSFDLMPSFLAPLSGFKVRLHCCALRGPIHYDQGRPLILKGADGVVFVADSLHKRREANMESLSELCEQIDPERTPVVLQYNKRDLVDVMSIAEMDQELRLYPWDRFDASALQGVGVFEALRSISAQIIEGIKSAKGVT